MAPRTEFLTVPTFRPRLVSKKAEGCQASANAVDEEAGMSAEADRHRQASLLWRSTAACDAHRRASITQGAEQPRRKLASSSAETGADHAAISLAGFAATFRQCVLRDPKSLRPRTLQPLCHRCSSASPHGDVEDGKRLRGNIASISYDIDIAGEPYKSENPKAPVDRLFAKSPRGKRIEIGGIWKKQNQNGGDYYALTVNTGYGKLNANLGRYPGQDAENLMAVIPRD